jgi:hypothetical protein
MLKKMYLSALLALCASGAVHAATAPLNVEELLHTTYMGPNGIAITIIRFADQNWTEIDPSALSTKPDSLPRDVCFEGKFESFIEPLGLKLTGVDGRIVFEDKSRRKQAPDLKALDNVWVCGTIRPGKNGRSVEVAIFELAKLLPDYQRFEAKLVSLERDQNAAELIILGGKIDGCMRTSKNSNGFGLSNYDKLGLLRDRAYATAIAIREKNLRPNDANACYEIAINYRDYLKRTPLYRTWVLKALKIDPEHSNAGKDAERNFNMIHIADEWMSRNDYELRQKQMDDDSKKLLERQKSIEAERTTRRAQEIAERTVRLLNFQAALRTGDPDGRVGAIKSLGEEVQKSLDLGFSLSAVDVLTNMNDPAAIVFGMDFASKSEFTEVRQLVYESLAWRASQNDVNSETAYGALASALKSEKMKEPAQAASAALVAAGGKGAVATLIAGLDSNETAVCEALIDGLKKLTHVQLQKKEEWITWWQDNKSQTNGKSF